MTEIQSIPPADPTGLDGTVGVHMGYMRRDIDEIKTIITETNKKIDTLANSFVTHGEFSEHLKADKDHEDRIRILEDSRMKVVVLTGTITGFLSIIGSYLLSLLR